MAEQSIVDYTKQINRQIGVNTERIRVNNGGDFSRLKVKYLNVLYHINYHLSSMQHIVYTLTVI